MDHRRILVWAEGHLERLEASSSEFMMEEKPYTIGHDDNSVAPDFIVRLLERPGHKPFPVRWVFMIGDTVHNLRVALDYLAFALVKKHSPSTSDTQIAFPICHTPEQYAKTEGLRVGGLPDAAKNIIERLQPYHRWHQPSFEPLAALDTLENVHKHRHVLDAGVAVSEVGYRIKRGRPEDVRWEASDITFTAMNDGAEVARYTLFDPKAHVEAYAHFHICFDKTDPSPARGTVVIRTLKRIRDHIRDDIFPKLEPFL